MKTQKKDLRCPPKSLPVMAQRLELYIYKNATSSKAYDKVICNLNHRIERASAEVQENRDNEHCCTLIEEDPEMMIINRCLQQRLLLLHHSSICANAECKKHKRCPESKKLWEHLRNCSDGKCSVKKCFSSRKLLSHHVRCTDKYCEVCVCVRRRIEQSTAARSSESSILNQT